MFIKSTQKERDGQPYTYYRLCESYRDGNFIRNRTLLCLGELEGLSQTQLKVLARRIDDLYQGRTCSVLSCFRDDHVEQLAVKFSADLKEAEQKALAQNDPNLVNPDTMKHTDVREIGAEWMCKQAVSQLGIDRYLSQSGWSEERIALAVTHLISRTVYPASELKSVSWIKENSAVSELTGIDPSKLTKDSLYNISHALYKEKEGLEKYLSRYSSELFDIEDNIMLYDLTNTYFEGRMSSSKLAKRGRSKEKRSDAKLIVLAVVVNPYGFIKHSEILEGNMADCNTLERMIKHLKKKVNPNPEAKSVIVIDAGIATEGNLALLKTNGYDYMCVSRKRLKDYKADTNRQPVQVLDRLERPIELREVTVEGEEDRFLYVKSQTKALKEEAMHNQFTQRFEQALSEVKKGIHSKGGTKTLSKVHERIGRIREKYASVHNLYEITVESNNAKTATGLTWVRKQTAQPTEAGVYFLRTSLKTQGEELLWRIYNIIREIEYTFRVLKTDLNLRPVFHKTDEATCAHLHLGLLAYWLVSTIRFQLKQAGINQEWREVVRIMNTQKSVTTTVENSRKQIVSIRKCSEPNDKVKLIYDALNYKYKPYIQKKSVVPQFEFFEKDSQSNQGVTDS